MSCLFNSISYFIEEDSYNARQKICDYLESNKPIIDGLETKDILQFENKNYIQNMRSMSTWGGAIEIQSACNIWEFRIIIHNKRDKSESIEFLPVSNTYKNTIELEWSGAKGLAIYTVNRTPRCTMILWYTCDVGTPGGPRRTNFN